MRPAIEPSALEKAGLGAEAARALAERLTTLAAGHPFDANGQEALWKDLTEQALAVPGTGFDVVRLVHAWAFSGRDIGKSGPAPVWIPDAKEIPGTNLGRWMKERGDPDYRSFHRWTVEHREEFWDALIRRVGIRLRTPYDRIRDAGGDVRRPDWLPGARLNIAESCLHAEPSRTAIVYGREGTQEVVRWTYADLARLARRVARGLARLGLSPKDRVALYLPMTPESVAIYLGVVLSGRAVVGIADASAPPDVAKRLSIAQATCVFTTDAYVRDGKTLRVYEKAQQAEAPRCVVLPMDGSATLSTRLRPRDLEWADFLPPEDSFDAAVASPSDATNILFSSGTTKDPKAIVWTHTTPIKCVADAHLHHDVRPDDVLAWPTSFGWMMGPWLTYASLVHGAAMALYNGSPTSRAFGEFVARANVTLLGVVPKLVRAWKTNRTMEGLDWSRIRRFSSTGETSDAEEMFYLMWLAGNRPVIEYCGGTEIGGGYITGTMVQPAAPATFTTPACGLDVLILDESGRPATRGEVALVPPSIGLSNTLLNYDHGKEYFEGFFRGPRGETLRRHGDQLERLGAGYYRHHGRMDDMINLNGVKTSVEELRAVLLHHPRVYDAKPIAVDLEGSGQHSLVVYVVPREPDAEAALASSLPREFERLIKQRLNPLLAHVHDVVLVAELPQAGPGKTRTMREFVKDYQARRAPAAPAGPR